MQTSLDKKLEEEQELKEIEKIKARARKALSNPVFVRCYSTRGNFFIVYGNSHYARVDLSPDINNPIGNLIRLNYGETFLDVLRELKKEKGYLLSIKA